MVKVWESGTGPSKRNKSGAGQIAPFLSRERKKNLSLLGIFCCGEATAVTAITKRAHDLDFILLGKL